MSKPRDVVVVRVSEKGDRVDEHFHSPEVQIEAARRWARVAARELDCGLATQCRRSALRQGARPGALLRCGRRGGRAVKIAERELCPDQ